MGLEHGEWLLRGMQYLRMKMYWNLIVVMIAWVFGYVKNQRIILSKECAI